MRGYFRTWSLLNPAPVAQRPTISLEPGATTILADKDGNGQVRMNVRFKASPLAASAILNVKGADLLGFAGAGSEPKLGRPLLSGDGVVTLSFGNLVDGGRVTVGAVALLAGQRD